MLCCPGVVRGNGKLKESGNPRHKDIFGKDLLKNDQVIRKDDQRYQV